VGEGAVGAFSVEPGIGCESQLQKQKLQKARTAEAKTAEAKTAKALTTEVHRGTRRTAKKHDLGLSRLRDEWTLSTKASVFLCVPLRTSVVNAVVVACCCCCCCC
jgi:hypothetical protein